MRSDDKARFQRNLRTDRNSSWADANARVDRPNWDKVRIVCVVRRAVVRWKVHDGNGYAGVLRRRVVGINKTASDTILEMPNISDDALRAKQFGTPSEWAARYAATAARRLAISEDVL